MSEPAPKLSPVLCGLGEAHKRNSEPDARKLFDDTCAAVVSPADLDRLVNNNVKYQSEVQCMFTHEGFVLKANTPTGVRLAAYKKSNVLIPLVCHEYTSGDQSNGTYFTCSPLISTYFLEVAKAVWTEIMEIRRTNVVFTPRIYYFLGSNFLIESIKKNVDREGGYRFNQAIRAMVNPKCFYAAMAKENMTPDRRYMFYTVRGMILAEKSDKDNCTLNVFLRNIDTTFRFAGQFTKNKTFTIRNQRVSIDPRLSNYLTAKWTYADSRRAPNMLFVDSIKKVPSLDYLSPMTPTDVDEACKDSTLNPGVVMTYMSSA